MDTKHEIELGSGRYNHIAKELYRDAIRLLKITPEQALRLGTVIQADLGRLQLVDTSLKISKFSKDGQTNLKSVAEVKKVYITPAIRIAKIVIEMDAVRKLGVEFESVKLDEELVAYLNPEAKPEAGDANKGIKENAGLIG